MATLAANKARKYQADKFGDLPMIASDILYQGSAAGESASTGTFRPLVGGDNFAGFCIEKADNSSGAASAINARVITEGVVCLATITGATGIADYNTDVYATDDDTFTTTASGASAIGTIIGYTAADGFFVKFQSVASRSI